MTLLFMLKKWVGGVLLPLPLLLLIMGLALASWKWSPWKRTSATLMVASWLLLLLLSLQPVADGLLRPLESHYPTLNHPPAVDYIVVLGGGYTYNPQWAPSSNLLGNSLARVTEGVRQWRMHPQAKMIFTGAAAQSNSRANASVAAEVAESLGVPREQIIELSHPRDTAQEAVAVRQVVDDHPLILVTSANHLPRALGFFHQQQLYPLPAPANQLAIDSTLNSWERLLPSPLWLSHSERAWYETLGLLWQRLSR